MAKLSVLMREKKRRKVVQQFSEKRARLKEIIRDSKTTAEERWSALQALQRLPRNASPVRLRNRCTLTGRPRGVYRRFGLGRNMLRIHAMSGDIPGLTKASW